MKAEADTLLPAYAPKWNPYTFLFALCTRKMFHRYDGDASVALPGQHYGALSHSSNVARVDPALAACFAKIALEYMSLETVLDNMSFQEVVAYVLKQMHKRQRACKFHCIKEGSLSGAELFLKKIDQARQGVQTLLKKPELCENCDSLVRFHFMCTEKHIYKNATAADICYHARQGGCRIVELQASTAQMKKGHEDSDSRACFQILGPDPNSDKILVRKTGGGHEPIAVASAMIASLVPAVVGKNSFTDVLRRGGVIPIPRGCAIHNCTVCSIMTTIKKVNVRMNRKAAT